MIRKNVISRVTPSTASADALQAWADHKARGLRITNMKEILAHSPVCFRSLEDGSYDVSDVLMEKIGRRATLILGYAIANGNECLICGNYFKKLVVDMGIDWNTFEFSEEEVDLLNFAEALVKDPNHVPDDVYEALQARYDEETMVLVITYSVLTLANNYFNNIVGTELDEYLYPYKDK